MDRLFRGIQEHKVRYHKPDDDENPHVPEARDDYLPGDSGNNKDHGKEYQCKYCRAVHAALGIKICDEYDRQEKKGVKDDGAVEIDQVKIDHDRNQRCHDDEVGDKGQFSE